MLVLTPCPAPPSTLQAATGSNNPLEALTSVFNPTPSKPSQPKYPKVIVPPSPTLGLAFLVPSVALSTVALIPSTPLLLFSVFLLIQTSRVRFVFDDENFSLQNAKPFTDELESSGENFVVGGANTWSYDSFVNWEFFPRSFPILVYFKEIQTPEEKWSEGPGSMDKVGGGQLHFFPAIADTTVLKEEVRGCKSRS